MGTPKDVKYLLTLAGEFITSASERERANYELLSAATKNLFKAFIRGRISAGAKGGLKEVFVGETPEEAKWKRQRSVELREELERELNIAEEIVNEANSLNPEATSEKGASADELMGMIYFVRGSISADAGDYRQALAQYEEGLKQALLEPQTIYFNYGLILEEADRSSEAVDVFEKAVDVDPKSEIGIKSAMEIRRLQYRRKKPSGNREVRDATPPDFCYHCGADNPQKAKICPNCGKPL